MSDDTYDGEDVDYDSLTVDYDGEEQATGMIAETGLIIGLSLT